MSAVDESGNPIISPIVSHQRNSFTVFPSIFCGPKYADEYYGLNGSYLIDFPGMFDSKGDEIDIIIDLTLQMIINRAKSTKIVLLLPST